MLQKAKVLKGICIEAIDGNVGTLEDLYMEINDWSIQFLLISLNQQQKNTAMLTPDVLGLPDYDNETLPVALTKRKILSSPGTMFDMETRINEDMIDKNKLSEAGDFQEHSMINDQDRFEIIYKEEKSLDDDSSTFDDTDFENEILDSTTIAEPEVNDTGDFDTYEFNRRDDLKEKDIKVQKVSSLVGFRIVCTSGECGCVEDVIYDDTDWVIRYCLINTSCGPNGNYVLLCLHWIQNVNWDTHRITINMSEDAIHNTPTYNPDLPITREYEKQLFDYYDTLHY